MSGPGGGGMNLHHSGRIAGHNIDIRSSRMSVNNGVHLVSIVLAVVTLFVFSSVMVWTQSSWMIIPTFVLPIAAVIASEARIALRNDRRETDRTEDAI